MTEQIVKQDKADSFLVKSNFKKEIGWELKIHFDNGKETAEDFAERFNRVKTTILTKILGGL